MCGITGVISKNILEPFWLEKLSKMENALLHRGPDGNGRYESSQVLLGMRRLSIIDLHNGWQPLWNENKSIVLIANGEIYNYIELQNLLKSRGHSFRTNSDCETIVHLYEEFGEKFYTYLRGMFAFCLYDISKKKVLIFRDRMGEKPIYYFQNENKLIFSSELRSILSSGSIPIKWNNKSIYNYFFYQYIPEPDTAIQNVQKLEAGNFLEINLDSWKIENKIYWRMEDSSIVNEDPLQIIRSELKEISKLIIRSDVPVGVALSGGMDSSAITALAVQEYSGTLHAFSVGYPGRPENDERRDALELAKILNIPFYEIELTVSGFLENFEKLNFLRDDPIADISGFGYYSVNQAARKAGIPVLLQGQGGDELFWGYEWVAKAAELTYQMQNWSGVYSETWKNLFSQIPFGKNLFEWKSWIRNFGYLRNTLNYYSRLKAKPSNQPFFYDLSPDFQNAFYFLDSYFTDTFQKKFSTETATEIFTFDKELENIDVLITKLICQTYLRENGITQGDRLSMAFSVELRLPLVDYKLTELVIGLRKNQRLRRDYLDFPKPWLKKSMKGIIPDKILNRPKKGFNPPVHEWHKQLFQKIGNQLEGGELVKSNILIEEAGSELSKGMIGAGEITPFSFKALVLENWMRQIKGNLS